MVEDAQLRPLPLSKLLVMEKGCVLGSNSAARTHLSDSSLLLTKKKQQWPVLLFWRENLRNQNTLNYGNLVAFLLSVGTQVSCLALQGHISVFNFNVQGKINCFLHRPIPPLKVDERHVCFCFFFFSLTRKGHHHVSFVRELVGRGSLSHVSCWPC